MKPTTWVSSLCIGGFAICAILQTAVSGSGDAGASCHSMQTANHQQPASPTTKTKCAQGNAFNRSARQQYSHLFDQNKLLAFCGRRTGSTSSELLFLSIDSNAIQERSVALSDFYEGSAGYGVTY